MWKPFDVNKQIRITAFYSLFEEEFDSGYSFGGESHPFWECVYVTEGNICVSGNDRVYILKKGDIIFHKPMEMHKFHIEQNEHAKLFIFSFSAEGKMLEFFCEKVFALSNIQLEILHSLLIYIKSFKSNKNENCILEHMYLEHIHTAQYLQMVSTYVCQLLLSLVENVDISPVLSNSETTVFKKAVNIMNIELNKQLSVLELSKRCNVSQSSIKRIFKKYSGLNVHEYYFKIKMNMALKYLKDGMNVTQVAEKLGFSSQSYFSYAFKRENGIPPSKIND